jgi:hypothetical protein
MSSFPHWHRKAPDARAVAVLNNRIMKTSVIQASAPWQQAAISATETPKHPEPGMEHRWGQRKPCRARVCASAGAGVAGSARLRDVSISGAFLETALPLPLFAQIAVAILSHDGATHAVEFTASVVRAERGGVGIEWCEPVSGSICRALGCTMHCAAHPQ